MQLLCIIQQSSMLHLNTHIFKHKNTGCNTILIAREGRNVSEHEDVHN